MSKGQQELKLEPAEIGQIPISLPADFTDGAYFVNYWLGEADRGGPQRFHFDFRRPVADERLNLNIVTLIENMDAEGWTRMTLGPMAPYVNLLNDWPTDAERVDAVLVIAEIMKDDDPRLTRLKAYLEQGGTVLVFGKPAASLHEVLPVEFDAAVPWIETPERAKPQGDGPWLDFRWEDVAGALTA